MTTINRLSSVDTLQGGDQIPVYDQSNGDARKSSLSLLLSWIQANISSSAAPEFTTQRSAPSSMGFNVAINNNSNNTWLILTPTAAFSAGTITLPAVANCVDKQEILVNCTQQIAKLTIDGNGATAVTGEPTALGADDFFKLKFDASTATWYRVG